ncbi:hypothetical protein ACFL5F_01195 [Planctomycetota bacterium]
MCKRLINLVPFVFVLSLTLGLANAGPIKQVIVPDLVLIEAENFHDNVPQGGHEWQLTTDPKGFSGTGFMQVMPDTGANVQKNYVNLSPRLDFAVNFVKTGTHYVWIRYLKTGGGDDSCHIGIDGQEGSDAENISTSGSDNMWNWSNERRGDLGQAKLEVASTGVHTVNVWMREDGFRLDKITLTTDGSYVPADEVPSVGIIPAKVEPRPIITEPIEPEPVMPKPIEPEPEPFDVPPPVRPDRDQFGLKSFSFEIGPELYLFEYEEPGYMKEEGEFIGVALGLTSRGWAGSLPDTRGGFMFRAEGRFAYGNVDYEGQTWDGAPVTATDIDDLAMEGRLLLGGDFLAGNTVNTIYAGGGYRYLNDDLSQYAGGYERRSNYFYVPIGYQFDSTYKAGWSFGFRLEYDFFIWGIQESDLSEVGLTDVQNDQESGRGYRASIKIQNKSRRGAFIIEPFFRYWDIDDSEMAYEPWGSGLEPANETTEIGVQIIFMF